MDVIESIASPPHISVVIATRNRSDDVRRCLESLSSVGYPLWDILLVDQSDDERTQSVAESFVGLRTRLRYCRMGEKGLSRARNEGMQATQGDVLAFLDDDCTVGPDWLLRVAAAFDRHPNAVLVFGAVTSAPHDEQQYFIPFYAPKKEWVMRGRLGYLHTQGIGASMYVRRAVVERVGPFDVHLGAGARRVSGGEDIDYLYRCLALRCNAVATPTIVVEHHGMRSFKDGAVSRLIRGYAYSSAVADMKMLRCGEKAAVILIAVHALYCLTRINPRNLISRRGPINQEWIVMYVRGLLASVRFRVDRRRCLYVD